MAGQKAHPRGINTWVESENEQKQPCKQVGCLATVGVMADWKLVG